MIVAQSGAEFGGHGDRHDTFKTCETRAELAHALTAQPAQLQRAIHFGQARGFERRQANLVGRGLAQIKFEQRGQKRLQSRQRQRRLATIAERHDHHSFVVHGLQRLRSPLGGLRVDHLHQNRNQADFLAADFDADLQIEPLVRRFIDVGIPIADRCQIEPEIAGDIDPPAFGAQLRNGGFEELGPQRKRALFVVGLGEHELALHFTRHAAHQRLVARHQSCGGQPCARSAFKHSVAHDTKQAIALDAGDFGRVLSGHFLAQIIERQRRRFHGRNDVLPGACVVAAALVRRER